MSRESDTDKLLSSVTIDDKTYKLGYNFNSLCDAEDVSGCNLLDALGMIAGGAGVTAKQLRGLLLGMLVEQPWWPKVVKDSPKEALKFAGQLVRMDTIEPLTMGILEACALAVNEEMGEKFKDAIRQAELLKQTAQAQAQAEEVSAPPVDGAPELPTAVL